MSGAIRNWMWILALGALGGSAHAGLPRILVADLHGQGDLKEIGVGVSVLEAAALSRSGQVEVVSRETVIKAFGKVGLPAREGLWLGPSEARAVCEATQCTQILIGTIARDAVQVQVTLRLLQHDGSVVKNVKLTHPVRQLPMLPQMVTAKARELLRIDAPPPPTARAPTLSALGGAWIAVQKRDADFAVIETELAGQPMPIALQFAVPAGDLAAAVGSITENPTAKVRIAIAIDPRTALKQAEALSDAKPNDTQARFLYARVLLEAGKGKEALALLAPREGEAEIAEAHELRGRAQLLLKNLPKAKEELGRAVELDVQNAEAHYYYGDVLARGGDARGASSEFQIASDGLRRKGDGRATDAIIRALQTDARMSKAVDLDARDMVAADITAAQKAIEHSDGNDPTFAPARAAVAAAAGDNAASKKALAQAREHNPSDAVLARMAARVAAEQGDHKAALAAYEQALQNKPTPEVVLDAAREAAAAGDVAKARELYTRAMASPQSQDVATRELGELELRKGDAAQAVELLKKAAAAEPDDAEVHLRLAQALQATGDATGANAEKVAANALDPDVAVEHPLTVGTGGNAEVGKSTATSAAPATGNESQAYIELVGQLPQLLKTFPPLREREPGGSIAIVHGTVPLLTRIMPGRRANAGAIDKALAAVLADAYHIEKVLPASESSATETTTEAMGGLAAQKNVDLVVAYTADVDDERIHVAMTLLDHRLHKLYTNEARLNAPNAIGSPNLVPLEIIVVSLVGFVGFLVLRPRGKLLVKIEYDPTMDGGMFSIRIFKLRRGGMGLKGGNEQAYVEAVRKSGASASSRAATMVGKETEFKLPAGKWWVYLFGVYVKNNKPQGNFLTEKRITVPRGKTEIAEFNLIPQETSVLVKVTNAGNPVFGAAVWLNQDEHKAVYTNKSAGGALILVPRGMHVVNARMDGKQSVQDLSVSSPHPMECIVDMTHAEPILAQAVKAEVAATAMTPSSSIDVHHSLQGQMYDLPTGDAAQTHPASATAVANATRYELRKELGRGAMGVVYEAWDTVLERSVALKVISQELKDRPDVVELFMREARSLAQLNHPNIVTVFDFGQRGVEYFMALELVHGKTLEEIMSAVGGPMPLGQVIDIAIEVCNGLGYAHERRVIHRDIKPANIFLLDDGRVKIMDFGLARVVRELSIKKTMISGTPLYMSPEQIRGTDLDFRADLYSLGCMVYEMLCGTPPFYQGEILYHHSHTMPDPPTARLPTLPVEVDAVIMRCLEKDKEARYPSVAEFAQALKGLKARLSGREAAV